MSVCIPARNAAAFVEVAVSSALADDGVSEVVLLDDASTDGTAELAEAFGDDRVRVIRHPAQLGRGANVDKAFLAGRSELVLVLPADDELAPGGIAALRDAISASGAAFAFGSVGIIDERGVELRQHRPFPAAWATTAPEAVAALLPHDPVVTAAALVRREAIETVGSLRLDIAPSHRDWDLFLRLATHGGACFVPDVVVRDRTHPANFTDQIRGSDFSMRCSAMVLCAFRDWALEAHPEAAELVSDGLRQWSRSAYAGTVLARAGLRSTSAETSLGLGVSVSPSFRMEPRFWMAALALVLPRQLVAAARPVLRRLDRPKSWI